MEGMHNMPGMEHHEMNHSMGMGHMGMKMYFHTDINIDRILFYEWMPMSVQGYIFSCLVVILAGISYEGIKYFRDVVRFWQSEQTHDSYPKYFFSNYHLLQTFLHAMQYLLSYSLMLVAMTFQVYLFLSIIVGAAIGYLIFTPLASKLHAEYTSFSEPCC